MTRIFCAKIHKYLCINFFVKKIVRTSKKREKKLFETAEWLKKLCATLPKWDLPSVEK